jgi:peptidoglycan/LPS O-acetylase OafA/YrhL
MPPQTVSIQSPLQPDTDNPGGERHIKALDGFRGFALLVVLFHHLFWSNTQSGNPIFDFISQIRAASFVGVNLFFALSGFLITGILLDTRTDRNYFKAFYARRALRIFPLYYGFLIFLFLLTRPLHFQWNGWQYYYVTYSANLALWRDVPLVISPFNIDHFWSLNVEEQFYLVWPFLIYRIKSISRLLHIALAGCLVVFFIRVALVLLRSRFPNPYLAYSPTFSCADNLLYGCAVALLMHSPWKEIALRRAPQIFVVCAVLLLTMFLVLHGFEVPNPIVSTVGFSLFGILSASLIAMILRAGSLSAQFFSNSALRFFGRYSYGLYVYHYSIAGLISLPLRTWFVNHNVHKALALTASALIIGVISTVIAVLSYQLFEIRFLKLKKYFPYHS